MWLSFNHHQTVQLTLFMSCFTFMFIGYTAVVGSFHYFVHNLFTPILLYHLDKTRNLYQPWISWIQVNILMMETKFIHHYNIHCSFLTLGRLPTGTPMFLLSFHLRLLFTLVKPVQDYSTGVQCSVQCSFISKSKSKTRWQEGATRLFVDRDRPKNWSVTVTTT